MLSAEDNGVLATPLGSFLLVSGRADVCPLRLGDSEASLRACGAVDAGGLRGRGEATAIANPMTAVDFWLGAAALLRARWAPGGAGFFLEAEGGFEVPFTQPTFIFRGPRSTVDKPSFAASVALSAGVRFR
jgi:hypothetical protein